MPEQFWGLTPVQFFLMVKAHGEEEARRIEALQMLLAWHAANVMNASGNLKRPISVEKLLGKQKKKQRSNLNPHTKRENFEKLKRELGSHLTLNDRG